MCIMAIFFFFCSLWISILNVVLCFGEGMSVFCFECFLKVGFIFFGVSNWGGLM